jgi:inward rectifier potassium channel
MRKKSTRKLIRRDGSFNVVSRGIEGLKIGDLYHSLLTINGWTLLFLTFGAFLAVNALFATMYWFCGSSSVDGLDPRNGFPFWIDCFFFSVQTFATVGYGKITPLGTMANVIMVIESFASLMMTAIITGLFFSRFSRATARILFSNKACLTTVDGDKCLFFRMANERFNQVVDVEIDFYLLKQMTTSEGKSFRVPIDLKLETNRISIFALGFTVFHIIDKESPFYKLSSDDIHKIDGQLIVSVRGMDGTMNQPIHSRHAYNMEDILIDHDFVDMIKPSSDDSIEIDLSLIHKTHSV